MTNRLGSVLAFVITTSFYLTAQADLKCALPTATQVKGADVEVTPIGSGCGLYITPTQKNSLVFRSYLFTDDGMFQIFNSFGEGPESSSTGARVYAFFPRDTKVTYRVSADENILKVQSSLSNLVFTIRTAGTPQLAQMTGGELKEDTHVAPNNNGGVEIVHSDSVYLDAGFGRGSAPQSNAAHVSTLHDSVGHQCVVSNRLVFTYNNGNASLKSDSEIRNVIAKECPGLKNF